MSDVQVISSFLGTVFGDTIADIFNSAPADGNTSSPTDIPKDLRIIVFSVLPILTLCLTIALDFFVSYFLFDLCIALATLEGPPARSGRQDQRLLEKDTATSSSESRYGNGYITSDVRRTLSHLQASCGDFSFMRGYAIELFLQLITAAFGFAVGWLTSIEEDSLWAVVTSTFLSLLLVQFSAAWVHIIASKPRHIFWFRRIPSGYVAILRRVAVAQVTLSVLGYVDSRWFRWTRVAIKWLWKSPGEDSSNPILLVDDHLVPRGAFFTLVGLLVWALVKTTAVDLLGQLVHAVLVLPVQTAFNRVEASLMPEDDEPIIPLDRSFNTGGDGILSRRTPITFRHALGDLRKRAIIRIAMVRLRGYVIYTALFTILMGFVYFQLFVLVGPKAFWILIRLANGMKVSESKFYELDGWVTKHAIIAVGPAYFPEVSMPGLNITRTAIANSSSSFTVTDSVNSTLSLL